MLPLTKTVQPTDLARLAPEIALIQERAPLYLDTIDIQASPYRVWEWAMALRAWRTWHRRQPVRAALTEPEADVSGPTLGSFSAPYQLLDIGGAGSPLTWVLSDEDAVQCTIMDPKINLPIEMADHIPDGSIQAAFSISVLEHVAKPTGFLRAIHRVLAPGGLLFLTMDCWNCEGPDTAHYHWMRERIYNPESWKALRDHCTQHLGFKAFGASDWSYHGNVVYGYTFCSLALIKEV